MKRVLALLAFCMPLVSHAGEFENTLLVQTGKMSEHDLIVRNITDLGSNRTCLAFYIKTSGTSPVINCYPTAAGFGASLVQVGHLKADRIVIRKLDDTKNNMSCIVAYVGTPGTSPAVDCYANKQHSKDHMVEAGHLREGDLDMRRIMDAGNLKACLIAYVDTEGTSPAVKCYDSKVDGKGGLYQASYLKEGDLVVRKILDMANGYACLVSYVGTKGTSSHLYCYQQ
ncbi:MAG: hypothetical protein KDI74_00130 [Gammaproteobacteria bacterium]|nr:hypothetical protein [Gammaproteobacteria bacterium]